MEIFSRYVKKAFYHIGIGYGEGGGAAGPWHEFHETCHSVTFYFMKVNRPSNFLAKFTSCYYLKMSFFHEINVTELRDGMTSLHGIHEMYSISLRKVEQNGKWLCT